MSGHADIIRDFLMEDASDRHVERVDALNALTYLEAEHAAENQRLRDALEGLVRWWDLYDRDPDDAFEAARAALAGTPSEDT
jgi:hypothetical protein